jgi:hypothetical protein
MNTWYWCTEDDLEPREPVDTETLQQLVEEGTIKSNDYVWRRGYAGWRRVHHVRSEFSGAHDRSASEDLPKVQQFRYADFSHIPDPTDRPYPGAPEGIGGWLLLFCIILTLVTPALFAYQALPGFSDEFATIAESYPAIGKAFWVETVAYAVITCYGLLIGIMLWRHHPSSKGWAKNYLRIRLGLYIFMSLILYILTSGLPGDVGNAFTGSLMTGVVMEFLFFALWFGYFSKSKRVANTYD